MIKIPLILNQTAQNKALWLQSLRDAMPFCTIIDAINIPPNERSGFEVAIIGNPDPKLVSSFPDLNWVHSLWAGVEHLLEEPSLKHLDIVRLVDPCLSQTMAEAALAWTLYLHREMPSYQQQQRDHLWRELPFVSAGERNVGVLGCGELGLAAISMLNRHGFKVHAWSRSPRDLANARHFHGVAGLDEIIRLSDYLVCLLPLTPATHHLLNEERLSLFQPSASIINFGRGGLIDTAALLTRLDRGLIKHAVLDVFEVEPLPQESVLWDHTRITVLPHISAPTSLQSASAIVATAMKNWFDNGIKPESVDRNRGY